ncbi:MAG TPA: DUF5674 family protein [Candidatus Babeliales bacterium]|nr:DUF5674 family protein [Candidatus Babeliales bacterium]
MVLVDKKISVQELAKMSGKMFERLVKAVVDIERGIMVVDADYHSEEECFLLEHGSRQEHLWGINIHPSKIGHEAFIEFDSMINIRPVQGNRGRGVYNSEIQEKIKNIVNTLVVI